MLLINPARRFSTEPNLRLPKRLSATGDRGYEVAAASVGLSEQNVNSIWRAMKRLYATGMSPGVGVAIRKGGELFFNRTLGYADLERREPLKVSTPVCLFSASKPVAAMLAHHLVEQGQLDLQQPVCHYLPEYGCAGKERTTLMHLLTHRAGIPRIREPVAPEDLFNPERIRDLMVRARPTNPGRIQAYHAITAGFVLGQVIEQVTGKNLNNLLDEVIRQPMGMEHFRYGLSEISPALNYSTGPQNRLLDSFVAYAVGRPLGEVVTLSNDQRFREITIPAGNLYGTAEEASRFYQMLLNDGEWQGQQLFRPDTVRLATSGTAQGARLDRTLLMPMRYSPGFMLGDKYVSLYGPNTRGVFGHLGFVSIYTWADRERDLAASIVTTGKGLLSLQMATTIALVQEISRQCAPKKR